MAYATLKLYKGVISSLTLITSHPSFTDPVADTIDLLNSNLVLSDNGGEPSYAPAFPIIKNGGVWSDPLAVPGRRLMLGKEGNVQETMTLVLTAPPGIQRAAILSKLLEFSRAARDYWQEESPNTPVYIEVTGVDAPGPQYAVIYAMDISADNDVYHSVNNPIITVVIEREPAWRTVPPGNAYSANFWPSINVTKADLKAYDERGTANVNYIDIPAEDIPGDMPADAYIKYNVTSGGPTNTVPFYISRSTRIDREPTNNSTGTGASYSLGVPRNRNTLNGGDAAVSGAWAIFADAANGLLSNNSIVTRYVARHNNALVVTNQYLMWRLLGNTWQSRYAVYVRAKLVAGATTDITLSAGITTTGGTSYFQRTPETILTAATYAVSYLGVLDLTRAGSAVRDDTGALSTQSGFDFHLILNKAAAVSVDLRIMDVVLMPIDEPNALIVPPSYVWANVGALAVDSANVLAGPEREFIARLNSPLTDGGTPHQYRGQKITLLPNMNNRLYLLPYLTSELVTGVYNISVDVYPRWAGMRSV